MAISHGKNLRRIGRIVLALISFGLLACAAPGKAGYEPAPGSYFVAPVASGDTVGTIAKRYQVGEDDVAALNRIPDPDAPVMLRSVRVPAYGRLHDPNEPVRVTRLRDTPVESRPLQPLRRKPDTVIVSKNSDRKQPATAPARNDNVAVANSGPKGPSGRQGEPMRLTTPPPVLRPAPRPQDQADSNASVHKFLWPVKGRLLSAFGEGADGEHNDGINIAANLGAPIRAADAGEVTYVGNTLKGYGNLILIRHDDGFVTAYAHAEKVSVTRKERVTRGQIIAYAGATGDVTQPQLHFELRRNTKPVDPTLYLAVASN